MEINFSNLHHAYLVLGEPKVSKETLGSLLLKNNIVSLDSPDLFIYDGSFGVDDARRLSTQAQVKAFGDRKVFIIRPESFTMQAQNALLKTFEEPIANTHFFLLLKDIDSVIPTLRSRVSVINGALFREDMVAKKFLKMNFVERVSYAKDFADKDISLTDFIDSLINELRSLKDYSGKIRKLYDIRRYTNDTVASSRLIIEHLALVL